MPNITSRKFTEKDKIQLNDSYNRFTSRSRTIEQFEWEWLNTPEGWGSMWLLEDTDTGKIIGHHGLIPIKFSYFGSPILVGKTENTHLHHPYAGKGVYYPFEVKFIEEAKDRFGLLYTTQGAGAPGRVRLKLGYAIVGRYAHYIKVTKRSYLDKYLANAIKGGVRNRFIAALLIGISKAGSVFLMPFFSREGSMDRTVKLERVTNIETVAEELDKFWEQNKGKFGITADRNSRYLKWRIFDNPNLTHEFFLARRQSDVVGYVITRNAGEGRGVIIDLIASNNDEKVFNAILDGAVSKFKESGIHVIHFSTLASDNFLNKALRRNGFVSSLMLQRIGGRVIGKRQQESLLVARLMAKALDDNLDPAKVADPACWYFTDILTEGIR
jgi:hypothetical protein